MTGISGTIFLALINDEAMRKIQIPEEAAKRHYVAYQHNLKLVVEFKLRSCPRTDRKIWKDISYCLSKGWLLSYSVDDVLKAKRRIGRIYRSNLTKDIKAVFNYKEFCAGRSPQLNACGTVRWKKSRPFWCKNEYFRLLDVRTCPYCNAESISQLNCTVVSSGKGNSKKVALFDFDHFFAQENYPYLSLALANMIPCCSVCNERLKLKYEPAYPDFVHPYVDDFHLLARFDVKPLKVGAVTGRLQGEHDIYVQVVARDGASEKVRNSDDFWQLSNRYANIYEPEIRRVLRNRPSRLDLMICASI